MILFVRRAGVLPTRNSHGGVLRTSRPDISNLGIALLIAALAAGLVWFSLQIVENTSELTAFMPQWMGTRYAVLERGDPYDEAFRKSVQEAVYGRQALSWENPQDFLYPYYSILLYLPAAFIADYSLAMVIWMTILGAALAGVAYVSLSLTRWQPPKAVFGAFIAFSLFNYYSVRALLAGNLAIMVALGIAWAFLAIQRDKDRLAGFLLAFSTVKPQMVALLLPFVVLWAVSRRRIKLLASLGVALALLLAASWMLQPGWLAENLTQMADYLRYTSPNSLVQALSHSWGVGGAILRWVMTIGLSILILVEWWRALGKDVRWFLWTSALTMTVTLMIGIPTSTSNYVMLIPVLTLVFSIWEQRWENSGRRFVLVVMLGLLGVIWWLQAVSSGLIGLLYQAPVMFYPLPLFTFATLYWVRYWALTSIRLQVDRREVLKDL